MSRYDPSPFVTLTAYLGYVLLLLLHLLLVLLHPPPPHTHAAIGAETAHLVLRLQ